MQQFEWPFGPDIPAGYDLRRLGWRLAGMDACASHRPILVDAAALSEREWGALFDPAGLGRVPGRLLLLGVKDSSERARQLGRGVGDVAGSGLSLAEVEARAERIATAVNRVDRVREVAGLRLDLLARDAFVGRRGIGLHPREFDMLWRLAETPGAPVSREQMLAEVWRLTHVPETNSVAVHVSRLRRKLAAVGWKNLVRTAEPGGYFLAADWPVLPLPSASPAEAALVARSDGPMSAPFHEALDGGRRDR